MNPREELRQILDNQKTVSVPKLGNLLRAINEESASKDKRQKEYTKHLEKLLKGQRKHLAELQRVEGLE